MNITVIGTGYVGLVTGTCFAETGNNVICVDIDEAKIKKLKSGQPTIYEPDLDNLLRRNIAEARLKFTTSLETGIKNAELIFLSLPTPPGADGSADISHTLDVSEKLGRMLKHYTIIVNKSTSPVGTTELVHKQIANHAKVDFDVVSNPEFLREGFAVNDFLKPDRVVVGTKSQRAQKVLAELYRPFVRQGNPIYFMDERSAEITKYAANSFLATRVSFINEIANLCELVDADVDAVRLGIGADERIGKRFLFPGIGYGGSCFPKDVLALNKTAAEFGYDFKILDAVQSVNSQQKLKLADKVQTYFKNDLKNKKLALWGIAFKPDTDDIREAPSLDIIAQLTSAGARIVAYDPEAAANAKKFLSKSAKNITFVDNSYEALKNADALMIATEWSEFRAPDFAKIKRLLKQPIIFDGRNLYDPDEMQRLGFYYESIGRKTAAPSSLL